MNVIAVLAQKGGVGKTTLALHWAVQALSDGPAVVLDTDPQGSAISWGNKRGDSLPVVRRISEDWIGEVIDGVRDAGVETCVIDTAPHSESAAFTAASQADFVVIPTRASIMDIEAIGATANIVRYAETPAAIVLNAVRPRGQLTNDAREALAAYKIPVCPVAIVNRAALAESLIDGRGVKEYAPNSKAADEIAVTWQWIGRRM